MNSKRYAVLALPLALGAIFTAASCNSTPPPTGLASGCEIDSDCSGHEICAFGRCHDQCATSKDCMGATCLPEVGGNVCELTEELMCSSTLPCVTGLTCANDTCRAPCSPGLSAGAPGGCLKGQTCTAVPGSKVLVCLDNKGGGSGKGDGGGTGKGDATMSDAKGDGPKGDEGTTGDGNPCVDPQLTFGNIGLGDSNRYFTSGVGARTATDLYIFSGYTGPDPAGDGGGANVGFVYVQAFDATTAKSKGPAKEFFPAPASRGGTVMAAAVAPTGQIALLSTDGYGDALFVTILDSASDGGVAGLQVLQTVMLAEGVNVTPAHVIWSNASQSFVVSWSGAGYVESVAKLIATGGQIAGGVASVTTDQGTSAGEPGNSGGASAGQSGNLLGVQWFSTLQSTLNSIGLTAFNALGDQVGGTVYMVSPPAIPAGNAPIAISLAGTAQGFVGVYTYNAITKGVFVPSSVFASTSDGGLADAGAFPTFTIPGNNALELRAVSDGVGTGGAGGVGVAQVFTSSTSFTYVHADGVTFDGPVTVFAMAPGNNSSVSVTNINGSFVVTLFSPLGSSMQSTLYGTEIAASGCQ
jgi:hypothetical protein